MPAEPIKGALFSAGEWRIEVITLYATSATRARWGSDGILGWNLPVGDGSQYLVTLPGRVWFCASMEEVHKVFASLPSVPVGPLVKIREWERGQ